MCDLQPWFIHSILLHVWIHYDVKSNFKVEKLVKCCIFSLYKHIVSNFFSSRLLIQGPLPQVKGMRWGNYLGSPSAGEPVIRWQQCYPIPPTQLMPLPTGSVCGMAGNRCLLVMYSKEKGKNSSWVGILLSV